MMSFGGYEPLSCRYCERTLVSSFDTHEKFCAAKKIARRADAEAALAALLAQELQKYDGGRFHSSLIWNEAKGQWEPPKDTSAVS